MSKEDIGNIINSFYDVLKKHMFAMRSEIMHPYIGMRAKAYLETIDYISEYFQSAMVCIDQNEVFNIAVANISIKGLNAEFGVKKGKSIKMLCQKQLLKKHDFFGFDSFEGLPKNWFGTRIKKGRLTNFGDIPKLPKNVKIVKGLFNETLPDFVKNNTKPFAFIHIDCDIYQSTKDIFANIANSIVSGTIIVFDEYFNYPNWQNHEYKAFQEFVSANKIDYEYIAYGPTQAVVKIK